MCLCVCVCVCVCMCVFRDRVSLCIPGCPGNHSVYQAGLELTDPPTSASWMQGSKVYATTVQLQIPSVKGKNTPNCGVVLWAKSVTFPVLTRVHLPFLGQHIWYASSLFCLGSLMMSTDIQEPTLLVSCLYQWLYLNLCLRSQTLTGVIRKGLVSSPVA